ncbi:MAG TPA: hypothetical protein PLP51_01385 [Acholeplasmataceae bacterium]|nr:hypothetical protein [Acholeplasmataceae bacterium]
MALKRCLKCKSILTTEQYSKGYDYCYDCYLENKYSEEPNSDYSSTEGLKKCKLCDEILTTEEYKKGYDYHLKCYLKIKGKKKYY